MLLFLLACTVDESPSEAPTSDQRDADDGAEADSAAEADEADTHPESGLRGPPEPTWCYSAYRHGSTPNSQLKILAFDMATGDSVEVGDWRLGRSERITSIESLATDGEHWVLQDSGWGDLYMVDRATDDVTQVAFANTRTLSWSAGTWVAWGGDLFVRTFDSLDDLLAATPSGATELDEHMELMAVDGDDVYGAWPSTNEIVVHEAYAAARTRTIPLEDWDTWVRGMSMAGNKLHLVDDGRQYDEQRIVSFDPDTGAQIEALYLPNFAKMLRGLWCTTEAPS